MNNISKPERKEAYLKVGRFCGFRLDGTLSEEEIAHKLEFSSAEMMYRRLKNWGLPDWMIGAEKPKDEGQGRKARSSGQDVELPRAADAEHLFREDFEHLNRYLTELPYVEEFLEGKLFMSLLLSPGKVDDHRSDHYEERFHQLAEEGDIWTIVVSEEEEMERFRKMAEEGVVQTMKVSEEEDLERLREMAEAEGTRVLLVPEENLERYRKVIEEAGIRSIKYSKVEYLKHIKQYEKFRKWYKDVMDLHPGADDYHSALTSLLYTHGAKRTPWEGLVYLIALHALMHDSVDPLIYALHPNPDEVDWEQMYNDLYRKKHAYMTVLKTAAKHIAQTVRGVKVEKGRDDEEASPQEMWGALNLIGTLAELGYPDKEIYQELKENLLDEEDRFLGVKYTVPEIKRRRELFVMKGEP